MIVLNVHVSSPKSRTKRIIHGSNKKIRSQHIKCVAIAAMLFVIMSHILIIYYYINVLFNFTNRSHKGGEAKVFLKRLGSIVYDRKISTKSDRPKKREGYITLFFLFFVDFSGRYFFLVEFSSIFHTKHQKTSDEPLTHFWST